MKNAAGERADNDDEIHEDDSDDDDDDDECRLMGGRHTWVCLLPPGVSLLQCQYQNPDSQMLLLYFLAVPDKDEVFIVETRKIDVLPTI